MRWLDAIPEALGSVRPGTAAFRVCGVAGFHAALVVTIGGGLLAKRPLTPLVAAALACALSFFGWALLRRRISGAERFVALEHVWVALGCAAAVLVALRAPVLANLDLVALGIAVFLATGRLGCLAAGCCHGLPSRLGVRNASLDAHVFPVPLVETAALAAITATGAAALPFAPPGTAVAWVLLSYGIVRFGLEWLRGDKRPEWMGLSQAQWMSATQAVAVIAVWGRAGLPEYAILAPAVAAALAYVRLGLGGRLRSRRHLAEVRAAVRSAMERPDPGLFLHTTTQGLSIAVSASAPDDWHVSISRPGVGLRTLCAVAAAAVPELAAGSARFTGGRVLHFAAPRTEAVVGFSRGPHELYFVACRGLVSKSDAEDGASGRAAYFGVKGGADA